MENKNLLFEINEIKRQMGLLVESPIPTSLLSNLFKKFIKGSIDDTFKKFFPRVKSVADETKIKNILNRIKSGGDNMGNTLRNLSTDELSLVLRSLNPTKAAKLMFDEGLLFRTDAIDALIESDVKRYMNGESIADIIAIYRDNIPTVFGFFKKGNITDKGFLEILDEYVSLYEKRLKSKLPKPSKTLETIFKNTITYKRLIINTFKSKIKIGEEIDSIVKELESAITSGNMNRVSKLSKKWSDYVSSIMPKMRGTTKEIANTYYKKLPKNVKKSISEDDFYKEFMERASLSGKEIEAALKNPWFKIVSSAPKGSSKVAKIFLYPTKELAKRLGPIIVRNSVTKMEEIILLLMNKKGLKGISEYAFRKTLAVAITTGAIFPVMKTSLTALLLYASPTVSEFFGIEAPDELFHEALLKSIEESLSKIQIKGFTNLDVIIPPIIDEVRKFIDYMTTTKMTEYGTPDEVALEKAKESVKNVVEYGQIIKNVKETFRDKVDMVESGKVQKEIRNLGYGNESERVYVIDNKQMYITNKGDKLSDYHDLYTEDSTGRLNYVVNNKKQYLKKDSELETNDSQTTTTNESPEQRWLSEHSNGSFKKLNPNKPTTWLYYTEPNNQGDRYIYKDNQFIQK